MGQSTNKLLMKIGGKAVVSHSVLVFEENERVDEIVIVGGEKTLEEIQRVIEKEVAPKTPMRYVLGGKTRQESVLNGIKATDERCTHVAIHDGARPLLSDGQLDELIDCVFDGESCAPGTKAKDTLKRVKDGYIEATVDREVTYAVQTPQCFEKQKILEGHLHGIKHNLTTTDDCHLMEMLGEKVRMLEGSYENIKITTAEDVFIAGEILKKRNKMGK